MSVHMPVLTAAYNNTPNHLSRQLVFPPKTDADGLIFLIHLILDIYPHHITITHILQCILKEFVHAG